MAILAAPAIPTLHPENCRLLQKIVYDGSGIVLGDDKRYLFEARLSSIAKRSGLNSIDQLCALLRKPSGSGLHNEIVEAMTTNETSFFRDPAQYEAIRSALLPELRERRATTRSLSFWSAAASAGQEAYSLAMLLLEQGFGTWNIHLLGTDLSTPMLEKARAARYVQMEVNRGLPAQLLVKYFQREGIDWRLKDPVRRMARFEHFDLRRPILSLGTFDAVFCRNVLIYFDGPTRNRILQQIHAAIVPGGWLLLGATEVVLGLEELYERRNIAGAAIYVVR